MSFTLSSKRDVILFNASRSNADSGSCKRTCDNEVKIIIAAALVCSFGF